MSQVLEILANSPLLTVFVVVALGTLLGSIPFGPIKVGAAGALFVGLAVGAADPRLGEGLGLVQSLGLALFVYTVGLAAGTTFFRELRRQLPMIGVGVITLVIATVVTIVVAKPLGISGDLAAGLYAGALTSTPTLAAAANAAGTTNPAVGYSIGYPIGVIVAIVAISLTIGRTWKASRDAQSEGAAGLIAPTVDVKRSVLTRDVPGYAEGMIRFSYLGRGDKTRVVMPGEQLEDGDRVVCVGDRAAVEKAIEFLGVASPTQLVHDRSKVDHKRVLVSDPDLAGKTLASLELPDRFNAMVTRIRRGDRDLLARGSSTLELGDRVLAVAPTDRLDTLADFFGNSERRVSEVDALTMGVGMALGLLAGLVALDLPGGITLGLGAAAGPLVVGMILGHFERSGPLVWVMPLSANLTIRQLGLLFFLAAVGLSSGQAFADSAFTAQGARSALLAAAVVIISAVVFLLASKMAGMSAARACGGLAGYVGQPAVLSFATSRLDDERIESGYAALFAIGIIIKIVLVQIVVGA